MSKIFCHSGKDGNQREHETEHDLGEKVIMYDLQKIYEEPNWNKSLSPGKKCSP